MHQSTSSSDRQWSFVIAWYFFKIAKRSFLKVSFLAIISKLSLIMALLLPLKVLLIVNSTEMPSYFPDFVDSFTKDQVILALTLSAMMLYVVHTVANKLELWSTSCEADEIIKKIDRLAQFQNQQSIVQAAYQSCTKIFAGIIISILAYMALVLINPDAGSFFIVYVLFSFLCFWFFYKKIAYVMKLPGSKLLELANWIFTIGFFLTFLYIVSMALNSNVNNIFPQIVALLLIRQVVSLASEIGAKAIAIKDKEIILSSILFGHHYHTPVKSEQVSVWAEVIEVCVGALDKHQLRVKDKKYFDTAHPLIDSLVFLCETDTGDTKYIMARIFWGENSIQYNKEMTVRDEVNCKNVFGEKIADITGQSFSVVLVEAPCDFKVAPTLYFEAINKYYQAICSLQISADFVDKCKRSEPFNFETLNLEKLEDFAAQQFVNIEADLYRWFFDNYLGIVKKLKSSPIILLNKDLNLNSTIYNGECVFINSWWHWSVEPVGSGIVPDQLNNFDIDKIASVLVDNYSYTLNDAKSMILLNAYCYSFSTSCKQGFMVKANEELIKIRSIIDEQIKN